MVKKMVTKTNKEGTTTIKVGSKKSAKHDSFRKSDTITSAVSIGTRIDVSKLSLRNGVKTRSAGKTVGEKGHSVERSSVKIKMAKKVVEKILNKKKTGKLGTVRIRTTPRPLFMGIKSLNEEQKKVVEQMGFGRLLSMKTNYIPSRGILPIGKPRYNQVEA